MKEIVLVVLGAILGMVADFIPSERKSRLQCRIFGHWKTRRSFTRMRAMPDGTWAPMSGWDSSARICMRCNSPVPAPLA